MFRSQSRKIRSAMESWKIGSFKKLESFFIDNLLSILEKLPVENGNIGKFNHSFLTEKYFKLTLLLICNEFLSLSWCIFSCILYCWLPIKIVILSIIYQKTQFSFQFRTFQFGRKFLTMRTRSDQTR